MINEEVKIDSPNEEGIGEVVVKGPNIMLGYYENEEEIKDTLVELVLAQQSKIKSQEAEKTDLKSQRRSLDGE